MRASEARFVVINQNLNWRFNDAYVFISAQGENTKKRAATIICTLLLLSALLALSSVVLVAERRNYYNTLEKGSGRKSAFRFLDSMRGKEEGECGRKGFVDVVEDDQMGDLIVVKEDNQEEEEGL